MIDVLHTIGSIASIFAVPLAVYLFLQNQPLERFSVQKKIVNNLFNQIDEGRSINLGEIESVIRSYRRRSGLRGIFITPNSVIDNLVTEINMSSIRAERKTQIIGSLTEQQIYHKLKNRKRTPQVFAILTCGCLGVKFSAPLSGVLMAFIDGEEISAKILDGDIVESFVLGVVISIVAISIVYLTSKD